MTTSKYLILGGGMVAGYAAKQLVEGGLNPGELKIVSADGSIPYERPPLSKGFLAGKDAEASIFISDDEFYRKHGIEIKLDCEADGVDPARKSVHLHSGEEIGFEKLVVATGARVKTLDIPGRDLAGIYYLRTLEDSKRIREKAGNAKRAVVIGGGFIAMEVASVLARQGIETTMVLPGDRIWKRFFTAPMSRFFENYYTARGVRFAKNTKVAKLAGAGAVEAAVLRNGEVLHCDMAVAGIGVKPVTEPLVNSGIEVADGVVVNEYLETNHRDIYAAGDVASYYDVLFDKHRRAEHWDNAVSQGQHCARAVLGARTPFVHVPYFFSDVFDLSYEFWGDPSGAEEVVECGDLSSSSFSVWWLRQGRLAAAFTMNRPDEEREAAPRLIQSKEAVSADMLRGGL
ncbi:MAG: FAD-dependent oxidoreductase [Bryobacterales bacterium]|nr:FAD-dependent oxidoreductase [Bryobacterales bacterium]